MTDRKRIAIYTQDAKLGNEVKGATRYVYLATLLHEHGYDVDFITSGFQHWEKRQRDVEHFDAGTDAYAIRFIEEPFYPKNMCPQRIWAHHVVAKRMSKYFDEHHDYDLIYCQIPPNDVAREIGKAAQKFNIPFVVDVNDLWPEAFRVAFDVPVLSDIIDIVEDDINVEDNILNLEDDANLGVEVMDYVSEVEEEVVEEESIPFALVEKKPSFMGGDANTFSAWVNQHLEYPEVARENGVSGRVMLQFTVNPNGTVTDVKVLRGVDPALDKEAVRVISSSPKWEPGRQRDRAVKVTYTFPVVFQLR